MTEEDTSTTDPTPGKAPGHEYPGTPRWVKISGIIVIGVILLVVIMLVVATALGLHQPGGLGGHGMGSDTSLQLLVSSIIENHAHSSMGLAGHTLLACVPDYCLS